LVYIIVNDDVGLMWNCFVDVMVDDVGNIMDEFDLLNWFVVYYSVCVEGLFGLVVVGGFMDGNVKVDMINNNI